jgi:hypothetical protein
MAELADALDLGSSAVKGVQVQVLFPAPALRSLVVLGISSAAGTPGTRFEASGSDPIVACAHPKPKSHFHQEEQ